MILLSMVLLFFMYITTILFHHSVSLDWRSEIKRIPVESHLFFETDLIKILLDFTVHSRKVVSWFRMSFFPTVRRPLYSLSVYLVACMWDIYILLHLIFFFFNFQISVYFFLEVSVRLNIETFTKTFPIVTLAPIYRL